MLTFFSNILYYKMEALVMQKDRKKTKKQKQTWYKPEESMKST